MTHVTTLFRIRGLGALLLVIFVFQGYVSLIQVYAANTEKIDTPQFIHIGLSGNTGPPCGLASCDPYQYPDTLVMSKVTVSGQINCPGGAGVHDRGCPSPGGVGITYYVFSGPNCASGILKDVTLTVGNDGQGISWILPSFTYTASEVGTFSFNAKYAGNGDWFPATTNCTPLIVYNNKVSLTYQWNVEKAAAGSIIASSTLSAGLGADYDGQVTYTLFSGPNCGTKKDASAVTVSSNGSVPNSKQFALQPGESYSLQASYTGANHQATKSSCLSPIELPRLIHT